MSAKNYILPLFNDQSAIDSDNKTDYNDKAEQLTHV